METAYNDEIFQIKLKQEGDKLIRTLHQPTNNIILERNNELRKNPGAQKDLTFGRQVANIPFEEYEMLRRKYPDLIHGDSEQRQNRLMKILASSEGRKYLTQDKL